MPDQEDVPMEEEALKRTTEISISAAQMRTFLKYESEDGPLKTLEKRLEVGESFLLVSLSKSIGRSVSEIIGPLQDPVIWCRLNYAVTQITQWTSKTKELLPIHPDFPLF